MPYHENQNLRRWWVILLCTIPALLLICIAILFNNENSWLAIALVLAVIPCLAIILLQFNLSINEHGIEYSISMLFKIYKKVINWNDISSIKVRPLNKLAEFGGLGIRYNPSTKIWGVIFQGDNGIEITKINGEKIEISTMNGAAIESVIPTYFTNK